MSYQHDFHAERHTTSSTKIVNERTPLIARASHSEENHNVGTIEQRRPLQTFFIILNLTCITLASSAATGLVTVGVPEIATELAIPNHLLLW